MCSSSDGFARGVKVTEGVVSVCLRKSSLRVSRETFCSVGSNFGVCLRRGLGQCLRVQSAVGRRLMGVDRGTGGSVRGCLSGCRGDDVAFISFFVSALIIAMLDDKRFGSTFAGSTAVLTFTLMTVSLLCLVFSV